MPRRSDKLPDYLPLGDLKKLLDAPYAANTRDRLILRLMANAGLRTSEVLALRRSAFRFDEDRLIVRAGKGGKDRVVPLTNPTLRSLAEQWTASMGPDDLIFDIGSRQAIYSLVQRYAERAGIERHVHPHQLRHSYAVYSLKSGMDLQTLSMVLGHTHLNTTAIYLRLTSEDVITEARNHPLPY